jgi:hypothetical protein
MSFALTQKNSVAEIKIPAPANNASRNHEIRNPSEKASPNTTPERQHTIGNYAEERTPRFSGFDFAKVGIRSNLRESHPNDPYGEKTERVYPQVMRIAESAA